MSIQHWMSHYIPNQGITLLYSVFILSEDNTASMISRFSHVQLFGTQWIVVRQVPMSMGFSRQEYWSGLPCPPPGDLPNPGIKLVSLTSHLWHQQDSLPSEPHGKPGDNSMDMPAKHTHMCVHTCVCVFVHTYTFSLPSVQIISYCTHFLCLPNSFSLVFFFRNFLDILVDFHMNYTINLSSLGEKKIWYFYQDHVKFISKLKKDQHLNDVPFFYPRTCYAFPFVHAIFCALQTYFKIFFI